MQRILNITFGAFVLFLMVIPSNLIAQPEAGYIVVLENSVNAPAAAAAIQRQIGGRVGFIYEHALKGFSITVPPQAIAGLERNPNVKYVATDDIQYVFIQDVPTGIQRIFADENPITNINGIDDRVDVDVAVIDTGIDLQHPDLNVAGGVICVGKNFKRATCVDGGDDDHYHGTHVAGTIGALDNGSGVVGVAPGARLWAVKVLNSSAWGYTSWIVAGIDWVAANADTIEVANMSLGGDGFNQAEYDAIQGAVNAGVAFAVAAGNDNDDARYYSPAAFDNVLSVSALADFDGAPGGEGESTCRNDEDDTLANFSNWGSAVDIAAPGVCIYSTFPGGYGTISGTSMASPHVAGALALLASVNNPANAADVGNLYSQVINTGNFGWTDDSGDGIQEPLLDVGVKPSNNPPVVTITSPADGSSFDSGESINFTGSATDEDGNLTDSLAWTSNLDGDIGMGGSFNFVLSDGTHTITAEVKDTGGLTGNNSITITVDSGVEPLNNPPVVTITSPADGASFNSGESISFAGSATDTEDGSLTNLVWTSSLDDQIGTGGSINAVLSDGTHTIIAEVTDSGGLTGNDSITITVDIGSTSDIHLSADAYKVKGAGIVELTWDGALSDNVDIYRNDLIIVTTPNDGEYTDNELGKGGGSATYQVCETGTSTCSNEVTAVW